MARRPTRTRGSGGRAFLWIALAVLGGAALLLWQRLERKGSDASPADGGGGALDILESIRVRVPIASGAPVIPRKIYLNREGALLGAGMDEASQNRSSIVRSAGLPFADVPAFAGTPKRWNAIVSCVRDLFAPFDVEVVDRRPIDEHYMMVVVGGHPEVLEGGHGQSAGEHDHSHAAGLAPFNGQVIEDAIVLVFARKLRENVRRTCEVVGMEVAHAYGLDHTIHCGDVMSYKPPCGRRRFLDKDLPCGEHEARPCEGSAPRATQNSHQRLMEVLGPAPTAPPT